MSISVTSQRNAPANWPLLDQACDQIKSALAELTAMTKAERESAIPQDQQIADAVRTIVKRCAGG